MLFDSIDFKAMEAGLNALNTKQQVISQNLSNIDTPGYKAKEVSFGEVLEKELSDEDLSDNSQKDYSFETRVTQTDNTYFTTDGNNVDTDKESLELYSTYLQSSAIIQKLNSTVGNYQYVLTNASFR